MSLRKWLHNFNQKQFGYRKFLKNLAEDGKEDIVTTDPDSGLRLVTTLYLDADMSFAIELPDGLSPSDITEEHKNRHMALLSEKIGYITTFFNHCVALGGFLGFIAPWLINYSPLLFDFEELLGQAYSLISSAVISTGVVVFRKKVAPYLMKQIAGKIFSIKFKGISFNKNILTSDG